MNAVIFSVILVELLIVSWIDLKTKKIFNYWFLVNVVISILFHFFYQQTYPLTWEILIFPIGWIAVGFLLFLLGIMGAGDSKYLASLFLIVPLEEHMSFLEKIIQSTMLVGGILLAFTIIRNYREFKAYTLTAYWGGIKAKIKSKFSYAPVILIAWLLLGIELWK